ncbi:MAG: hypothetical protein RLZZ226_911 [Pseudomonadota bacterium]
MMQQQKYTVRFTTPAFLGNAEQSGQWRTPPFKALLRQWWRIAWAARKHYEVDLTEMRQAEGWLFGNAWLENDFRKSRVLLRLDRWDEGTLRPWPGGNLTVHHPEAGNGNQGTNVDANLYLGYGPLRYQNRATQLKDKANAAIQADETAQLSIAVPENDAALVWQALWLMDRYGSLGGRSRNGWGSFTLTEANGQTITPPDILRPWEQALTLDWPHAIGKDQKNRPLIWQTGPHADWQTLMQTLARIKIGLRTQFRFNDGHVQTPRDRHWLSYPVTNHRVNTWDNNARLPNSLRFKVRPAANNQVVGVIFHVPCLPPARFNPDQQAIKQVWNTVHAFLDQPAQNLTRIKE